MAAKPTEIKSAYRQMQKLCHPDIMGGERGHNMSILCNEAYTVLSNEITRSLYDVDLGESKMEQKIGFTNKPLSDWLPSTNPCAAQHTDPAEDRAVFVDERTCIGCKHCAWQAPLTFILDEGHGRARATKQWADSEPDLQAAIDSCPVDCIHWVARDDLPVLEHVMKNMDRINTGIMNSYNRNTIDVFQAANTFRLQKAAGRDARRSWTEAYMYSKAQEDAMERARSPFRAAASQPRVLAKFSGFMAWIKQGLDAALGIPCRVEHTHRGDQAPPYEAVPLERSLVPIRVHHDEPMSRGDGDRRP